MSLSKIVVDWSETWIDPENKSWFDGDFLSQLVRKFQKCVMATTSDGQTTTNFDFWLYKLAITPLPTASDNVVNKDQIYDIIYYYINLWISVYNLYFNTQPYLINGKYYQWGHPDDINSSNPRPFVLSSEFVNLLTPTQVLQFVFSKVIPPALEHKDMWLNFVLLVQNELKKINYLYNNAVKPVCIASSGTGYLVKYHPTAGATVSPAKHYLESEGIVGYDYYLPQDQFSGGQQAWRTDPYTGIWQRWHVFFQQNMSAGAGNVYTKKFNNEPGNMFYYYEGSNINYAPESMQYHFPRGGQESEQVWSYDNPNFKMKEKVVKIADTYYRTTGEGWSLSPYYLIAKLSGGIKPVCIKSNNTTCRPQYINTGIPTMETVNTSFSYSNANGVNNRSSVGYSARNSDYSSSPTMLIFGDLGWNVNGYGIVMKTTQNNETWKHPNYTGGTYVVKMTLNISENQSLSMSFAGQSYSLNGPLVNQIYTRTVNSETFSVNLNISDKGSNPANWGVLDDMMIKTYSPYEISGPFHSVEYGPTIHLGGQWIINPWINGTSGKEYVGQPSAYVPNAGRLLPEDDPDPIFPPVHKINPAWNLGDTMFGYKGSGSSGASYMLEII